MNTSISRRCFPLRFRVLRGTLARAAAALVLVATVAGAAPPAAAAEKTPADGIPAIASLDLARFMGDWHVIAATPTWAERNCHASLERYALRADGKVDNIFECRVGAPDGKLRRFDAVGRVTNAETRAEWRVSFFWPVSFPYRVYFVDEAYELTAVGTPSGRWVWVMARAERVAPEELEALYEKLEAVGVDTTKLVSVPR